MSIVIAVLTYIIAVVPVFVIGFIIGDIRRDIAAIRVMSSERMTTATDLINIHGLISSGNVQAADEYVNSAFYSIAAHDLTTPRRIPNLITASPDCDDDEH